MAFQRISLAHNGVEVYLESFNCSCDVRACFFLQLLLQGAVVVCMHAQGACSYNVTCNNFSFCMIGHHSYCDVHCSAAVLYVMLDMWCASRLLQVHLAARVWLLSLTVLLLMMMVVGTCSLLGQGID